MLTNLIGHRDLLLFTLNNSDMKERSELIKINIFHRKQFLCYLVFDFRPTIFHTFKKNHFDYNLK